MVGEGGQPEVGCTFYKGHRQQCYVTDTTAIHSTGRDGTELVGSGLAPHTSLLMSPIGSTGPVVHLHGLTGLTEKLAVKVDLAI